MEATATKGIWIERLPKGYVMWVNTINNKLRVFSPSKEELLIVECPKGIYPVDVDRVRTLALESFNLQTR